MSGQIFLSRWLYSPFGRSGWSFPFHSIQHVGFSIRRTLQSSVRVIRGQEWNVHFLRHGSKCSALRIKDTGSCPSTPTKQMDDLGCPSFQTWHQNQGRSFCRHTDSWALPNLKSEVPGMEPGHFDFRRGPQLIVSQPSAFGNPSRLSYLWHSFLTCAWG